MSTFVQRQEQLNDKTVVIKDMYNISDYNVGQTMYIVSVNRTTGEVTFSWDDPWAYKEGAKPAGIESEAAIRYNNDLWTQEVAQQTQRLQEYNIECLGLAADKIIADTSDNTQALTGAAIPPIKAGAVPYPTSPPVGKLTSTRMYDLLVSRIEARYQQGLPYTEVDISSADFFRLIHELGVSCKMMSTTTIPIQVNWNYTFVHRNTMLFDGSFNFHGSLEGVVGRPTPVCAHSWKTYDSGFSRPYEYCEYCNEKKS